MNKKTINNAKLNSVTGGSEGDAPKPKYKVGDWVYYHTPEDNYIFTEITDVLKPVGGKNYYLGRNSAGAGKYNVPESRIVDKKPDDHPSPDWPA